MSYELSFFEQFIHEDMPAVAPDITEQDFNRYKEALKEATAGVKSRMIINIFTFRRRQEIAIYIEQHQNALIALADALLDHMDIRQVENILSSSPDNHYGQLCKLCYRSLEEILSFIDTYFSRYFNQDIKPTEMHRLLTRRSIESKLPILTQQLMDLRISEPLLELALSPLKRFITETTNSQTYKQLIWVEELASELQQINLDDVAEADKTVTSILCYLNFNSFRFYRWCVDRFLIRIREEVSVYAQMERAHLYLKQVNQLQPKPGYAWRENRLSIKDMLKTWLEEELRFLAQKFEETKPGEVAAANGQKISTNISVPQFAYLVRLMVETGLLYAQNLSELIRFFSEHFTSRKTQQISALSFRVKYYNTDRATADAVRDWLRKMLQHSRSF